MTEKVLVVDDDGFTCQLIDDILTHEGYQVATAGDGMAACEMIEDAPDRFDLILLDKHMPRLDGLEFLARFKQHASLRDIPVILLTGDDRQQDIAEGLSAGAYYYLTKPAPEAVLKQVVRNALNDLRQQRELRAQIGQRAVGLQLLNRAEFSVRTIDDAKNLALVLADGSRDPARTVNGYSELLINAVEHGNLAISYAEKSRLLNEGDWAEEIERRLCLPDYAQRRVRVAVTRHKSAYTVTIYDEGDGFDWRKYLEFSPERAFDLHGRGIAMSKAMSFDDLRYLGNGNTVATTVYTTPVP